MSKKYSYTVPAPCKDCPFRKDVTPFLTRHRAKEIAEALLKMGEAFTCHKTNDFNDTEAVITERSRGCAGAALVLEKEKKPNQAMQVAERLGYYTKPNGENLVFDNMSEFVDHHSQ